MDNIIIPSKYQIRKIQSIVGDKSFSLTLPKSYATNLGIAKGDYVKVWQQGQNQIVIQKELVKTE